MDTPRPLDLSAQRPEARAELVSVIVPVSERPERLTELYWEYAKPLRQSGIRFEFVFVAEPWHRAITAPLQELIEAGEPIRALMSAQTLGETALLKLGAAHARGSILVTLPPYRRIVADMLPELIGSLEAGADLVVARRWPRCDSVINRLQNRLFHLLIRPLCGTKIRDVACGVRVMRRELLEDIPLYGDFGRFFPLLAAREGYRVVEKDCTQHPNDSGTRVYSPGVYLRRLLDVLGLVFVLRFTEKPLRFFGLVGSALCALGGALLVVLLAQRLGGQGIADRPLLLLGVLLVVMGVQAVALGLIGEIIVYLNASGRRVYRMDERHSSIRLPNSRHQAATAAKDAGAGQTATP